MLALAILSGQKNACLSVPGNFVMFFQLDSNAFVVLATTFIGSAVLKGIFN